MDRQTLASVAAIVLALAISSNWAKAAFDFLGHEQMAEEAYRLDERVREFAGVKLEPTDLLNVEAKSNLRHEARKKWGTAANGWKRMHTELQRAAAKHDALRTPAQMALFRYTFCLHQFAVANNKPDYTKRAAKIIFQLEKADKEMGGLKKRYVELLENEPTLREA